MTAFLDFLTSRESVYGDREVVRVDGAARSYPELMHSMLALASGLGEAGVTSDDHVVLMMDTSIQAIDAWFAASVVGCTEIPINTKYRGELLRYLVTDCEATVIICDAAHLPTLLALPLSDTRVRLVIVNTDDPAPAPNHAGLQFRVLSELYQPAAPVPSPRSDRGRVVLYTSGTTGPSKGVVHSQASTIALSDYTARSMEYITEDALLNFFPLYHQNARYSGVGTTIAAGARLQLDSRLSTSEFWSMCRANGITAFNYLGSVLTMILGASRKLDEQAARDHQVRKAYGAGAPRGIWEEFQDRFGVQLYEAYGLTEAPMVTISTPRHRASLGSAGSGGELFEVQVLDAGDSPAAPGEVGEIAVRPKGAHGFMTGYYGKEAETLRATSNLWFHTGDRGSLAANGELYFEERAKDAIRRRGENISAWEVEAIINRHQDVQESAVYGIWSDESDEEVMVAVVLSRPDADLPAIVSDSAAHLPYYAVPRYVRAVAELPRTDTLKVQKAQLREEGLTADTVDLGSRGVRG
jgi:crotonobetaine/carnitine-CoA ligase